MAIKGKPIRRKRSYKKAKPFTKTQYFALKKMFPMEKRFQDTSLTGGVSNSGSLLLLTPNNIPRDGNQISLAGMYGKWKCTLGDSYNDMRVIVFIWKPDTTPSLTSVLDPTAVAANRGATANYNIPNAGLYKVLYDKTIIVDGNDPTSAIQNINLKRQVNKHRVIYDDDAASATTGQYRLYLVAVGDSGVTPHPEIELDARVSYTDA